MSLIQRTSIKFCAAWLIIMSMCVLENVAAEGECMPNEPIECYHCDSEVDRRCKNPFNASAMTAELIKPCKGCCVKMVRHYNQHNERVMRLCTRDMVVRLFMIDHVCMSEHDKTGHMCFCEKNFCNRGSSSVLPCCALVVILTLFLLQ